MGKKFKLIMFWITVLDSESFLHLPSLLPDKTWDQAIIIINNISEAYSTTAECQLSTTQNLEQKS